MKNIIVGTAGHVDHGKTTLIHALTGINTDRLREEQERGMTIDLGFASLTLPNGQRVGIVDVPGHERFLKNMLAGAGGVDVALMVIAADESVMPQTTEHLEILQLLEVKRGVIALTKADLVEEEWLAVVADDIRAGLADTFLADAPILPVSGTTGMGMPELLDALQTACDAVERRDSSGAFRIPIDRVFTLTGFGTVITGTLASGTIRVGDPVEVLPPGLESRARQIQVHGQKVDQAEAGTRVAVNLAGIEVADLARGDVVATPGTLKASAVLDVRISLLGKTPHPLKNRARVRFHAGTAEILGRLTLLDRDELKSGDAAYAQFRAETPTAVSRGDRFVIRSYSPMVTIGGGVVVDAAARKHKRFDAGTISSLDTASRGTPEELLEQMLKQAVAGIAPPELLKKAEIPNPEALLESLRRAGRAVTLNGGKLIHASVLSQYSSRMKATLSDFHARHPLRPGMSREELRGATARGMDNRTFSAVLTQLESGGIIATSDTSVRLPDFEPVLTAKQQSAADSLGRTLLDAGLNVPDADEFLRATGLPQAEAKEILEMLVYRGEVVKIAEGMYLHASTVTAAESTVRRFLEEKGKLTVSEFRDLTGTSRKYAVPLLEYFDSKRITRRVGDERVAGGR
ncbi:MAG: selenocysteine-specific translation elongation factor [Armatimonadetes bacterium]|nr:selenocysteine-specific translation elongation factor [Armatimonadota bacterium]